MLLPPRHKPLRPPSHPHHALHSALLVCSLVLTWESAGCSPSARPLQTTTETQRPPPLACSAAAAFTTSPHPSSLLFPFHHHHNAQHPTMTFTRAWLNTLEAMPRSQVGRFEGMGGGRGGQERGGGETHETRRPWPPLTTTNKPTLNRPSLAGLAWPF